jgi:hypothetical protein
VYDSCYASYDEFCDADNNGWSVFSCSIAQCTSGDCCDNSCGVYEFLSSSTQCASETEYGCAFGNELGDDVWKRTINQYCPGSSSYCSGDIIYGGWSIFDDCTNQEYCENGQCLQIACSSDSDCASDYWYGLGCSFNDIYGTFVDYSCKYPGTKQSECISEETYKQKQDCGISGYVGEAYCYLNDVYRDYVNRGCEEDWIVSCYNNTEKIRQEDCGTSGWTGDKYCCDSNSVCQNYTTNVCSEGSCDSTQEVRVIENCEYGCSYGQCDEEECVNECALGQIRCSGDYAQTCGNYDEDSCLEWPSSTSGDGNEYCPYGCENGECKVECYIDSDCGTDGWTGEPYCLYNDVYQYWRTNTCKYAGTSDSYCSYSTTRKVKEECPNKCTDGRCLVEVCKIICNLGACYEICDWQ